MLEVENLVVHYGKLPALVGIDLVVPEGSVVALLGPNGAGKSTTLKAVAGLVEPSAGSIRIRGEDLDGSPAYQRSLDGICLIPEGRGIFPNLTVADNLQLALAGHDERRDDVMRYFPRLAERVDQPAGTLSGGEQQMLALARAVASDPVLLMADELSLGLAPLLVANIFDTVRALHQEGRTVLLVEQYATQALALADLVYILSRGQVVWAGEPDELEASDHLAETYLGV
ncbi:MAG: ABC transporter ATP-binding protein [Actinobacteria bacterium]|nr:ABC transporter ATP-binding protein [Actinomycetota bacterium]